MDSALLILEIFMYIAEAAVFLYYGKAFFEQRFKISVVLPLLAVGFSVLFGIYQLDMPQLNYIAVPITYITLNLVLFKSSVKSSIFHALILLVAMTVTETITMTANAMLYDVNMFEHLENPPVYMVDILFSKITYSALVMSIAYVFRTYKSTKKDKVFWLLFISPLSSVIATNTFYYMDKHADFSDSLYMMFCISEIFMFITNIVVFFVYSYSLKNTAELYELKFEKERQETDSKYLQIIEQNNKSLGIIVHDIKNHLIQIKSMESSDDIHKYVDAIAGEVQGYAYIGMSKNKTLDLLISKYIKLCESNNIRISFDVKTANLQEIVPTDISTIINNLLDNAVEAAGKSKEKTISVSIFRKQSYEIIKIQNSCDIKPLSKGNIPLTTKKEKSLHGYGMPSVIKTVNKYDGVFTWEYLENKNIFDVTVMLPVTSE